MRSGPPLRSASSGWRLRSRWDCNGAGKLFGFDGGILPYFFLTATHQNKLWRHSEGRFQMTLRTGSAYIFIIAVVLFAR
jgi:hypothetical protein